MTTPQPTPPSSLTSSSPKRLAVAINPSAAFGASRSVGMRVVAALRERGHLVTVLLAADFAQLSAATRLATRTGTNTAAPHDALVVVGGDGMVSLGTAVVAGTGIPLGIIPCGTGNDLARGLGLPLRDVAAAVDVLCAALEAGPRDIDAVAFVLDADALDADAGDADAGDTDAGDADAREARPGDADPREKWFAGVLSAGFDAAVNERANSLRYPRGRSRYLLALLIEIMRLTPREYRLELDGVELVTRAVLVSVGNNVSIGGGMRVTPNALLDDGLLDVLVVAPLSRLAFLRIFPRVFAGTHLSDPRVTVHRVRRVRIESSDVVMYADGERVGEAPITMEVRPGALRVLAPRDTPEDSPVW